MEKAKIIYNGNVNLERVDFGSSGFNFNDSPMQKILKDTAKALQDKKESVINEALSIHVAEKVNLINEIKRMFPRIKCIQEANDELWYWDNGTKEGLLLVVFYQGDIFKGVSEERDGKFFYNSGIEYVITPKA